jgi:hypothetical protein
MRFIGVARSTVWSEPGSDGSGDWGMIVHYGTAGDTVFLRHATGVAPGDILFA